MKHLARYIHGSQDSLDLDTLYLVDQLPSDIECKTFTANLTALAENANIASFDFASKTLKEVYKGTVDELNNSLMATYPLHSQSDILLIESRLERHVSLKLLRVIRCILSYFSRTELRTDIKQALRSPYLTEKLSVLEHIDLTKKIDFGNKTDSNESAYKTIAFQLAQIMGLFKGIEIYTKHDVVMYYPMLYNAIYRVKCTHTELDDFFRFFLKMLRSMLETGELTEHCDVFSCILQYHSEKVFIKEEKIVC